MTESPELIGSQRCLKISRKLAEKSNGFSIDIGGSIVKIVYLAKEEWENSNSTKLDQVNVYMKTFSKDDIEDAMKFLKERVYIKRASPKDLPVIFTSGVGSNMMAPRFNEELSVRVQNTLEFDDFILALEFLQNNLEHEDVFLPIPKDGFSDGLKLCSSSFGFFESDTGPTLVDLTKMKFNMDIFPKLRDYVVDAKARVENGEPLPRAMPKSYPYVLGQFGSGFCFLVVDEDGSYEVADLMAFSGRTFLDLGRLITGVKSYEELIKLAEEGHEDNVNVRYSESVVCEHEDIYTSGGTDDVVIYSFGKVHGKTLSEVSKADLARGLLQNICLTAVGTAFHVMLAKRCRNLYVTGSFVSSELTQNLLFKEFEGARSKFMWTGDENFNCSDLRMEIAGCSSCMGCLGAFLFGCQM